MHSRQIVDHRLDASLKLCDDKLFAIQYRDKCVLFPHPVDFHDFDGDSDIGDKARCLLTVQYTEHLQSPDDLQNEIDRQLKAAAPVRVATARAQAPKSKRRVRVAMAPDGADFNDLLRAGGPDAERGASRQDRVGALQGGDGAALFPSAGGGLGGDPPAGASGGDGVGDPGPIIKLVGGQLPKIVYQAETALIASKPDFYRYGGQLVRPVVEEVPAADMTRTQVHRLAPLTRPHLVDALTRAARFQRYDRRSKRWVDVDCPDSVAETYLARDGQQRLPALIGVINAPMLRSDGSLLDRQGYDARTGLLFRSDARFETIPDRPTKDEALRALALLNDPLSTFPFVTPSDRSVALSGILTALDRRAEPAAPIHAFSAPVAGSGKTLLVDLISIIATGRRAPVLDQSKDDVETDKRLVAALMRGGSLILIDNIERPLDSALLCQAASTHSMMQLRMLGSSRDIEVPNTAMLFATGNNLVLAGDLTRRAVIGRLDPGCERPELREFNCDPVSMVREDRPRFVNAALTILRAYFIAADDDRVKVSALGSYEVWSSRVREALIWLGCADPCDTMATARRADPVTAALSTVIAAWKQSVGVNKPMAVQAVVEMVSRVDLSGAVVYPELKEALLAVAGERREINVYRLGKWLSKNEDRVIDRHRIARAGTHGGTVRWVVADV
jgi:hypothetical protein